MAQDRLGRRAFLAASLSALTSPAWVGTAFAAGPSQREKELFEAWHGARRVGLPLLVVVVPHDDRKYPRGRAVGATLTHASDALLAKLSGARPACATVDELRSLGVKVSGHPWFVLVEAGELPAGGVSIAGPSVDVDDLDGDYQDVLDAVEAVLLEALPNPGAPASEAVARGRAAWVPVRLPGSHWAVSRGCGLSVEDVDSQLMTLCGMGHVPEKAARLLYFFEPLSGR